MFPVPHLNCDSLHQSPCAADATAADRMHRCDVCERDIHGEAQWAAHLRSRPHRKKQDGQRRRRQREGDLPCHDASSAVAPPDPHTVPCEAAED